MLNFWPFSNRSKHLPLLGDEKRFYAERTLRTQKLITALEDSLLRANAELSIAKEGNAFRDQLINKMLKKAESKEPEAVSRYLQQLVVSERGRLKAIEAKLRIENAPDKQVNPVTLLMDEIKEVEESCFSQAQLVIYSTDSFLSQLEECLGLDRSDQEGDLPTISFWGVDLIVKDDLPENAEFIVTLK